MERLPLLVKLQTNQDSYTSIWTEIKHFVVNPIDPTEFRNDVPVLPRAA